MHYCEANGCGNHAGMSFRIRREDAKDPVVIYYCSPDCKSTIRKKMRGRTLSEGSESRPDSDRPSERANVEA